MKSSISLAIAVLMMLACTGHSTAGDQVPYKDRVETEIVAAQPAGPGFVLLSFEVVRGQGTHVGRFTTVGELLVELSTLEFVGVNTLTAANGDQIFIDIVGGLTPTGDPDVLVIDVETEFVGGTGRFVGATGGFTGTGELLLGPGGAFVGATFTGVGKGTISRPGKK